MLGPGPLILLIMTAFGMQPPGPRIMPGLGPHIIAPGLLIGPRLTIPIEGLGPAFSIMGGLGPIPHPPVLLGRISVVSVVSKQTDPGPDG